MPTARRRATAAGSRRVVEADLAIRLGGAMPGVKVPRCACCHRRCDTAFELPSLTVICVTGRLPRRAAVATLLPRLRNYLRDLRSLVGATVPPGRLKPY